MWEEVGSPGWARTSDFLINSQALYQLSYRGTIKSYRSFAATRDSAWTLRHRGPDGLDRAQSGNLRRPALDSLALIVYKC